MNRASPAGPNGGSWIAISGVASSINANGTQPSPYAARRATTAGAIIATPKPMLPTTDRTTMTCILRKGLDEIRSHRLLWCE